MGGHANVNIPDSWALEDNVGVFGDFRISRNVTTAEGCTVSCKYMIHYDKLANQIQFVGRRQGVRCVKQQTAQCTRATRINRMQTVTQEFRQHCVKITHILYSRDSSSPESSLRMEEPSPITTSRRNPPSTLCSDSVVACRSSLRPSLERLSPSKSSHPTPLRMSRPRSRTRKVSHPTNRDSSSPASSSRMDVLLVTTTSRRSQPSILSSD